METTSSTELHLHVVAFRGSSGFWVAQCLEHDIATQARTEADVPAAALRILQAYILRAQRTGTEPFAGIPKAPQRFWEMYEEASGPKQCLTLDVAPVASALPMVELRAA